MAQAIVTVQGEPGSLPTLLGQAPARIPTGGKIRPGIMVLTRKAAEQPEAKAIYTQGVAEGRSFEAIEKALAQALPQLKSPLVPRNVPWFTVRGSDVPQPGNRPRRSSTPMARIGGRAIGCTASRSSSRRTTGRP